jgi:hypothetical protein
MRGTAGFYSGWPDGPLSQGKMPDNGLSGGWLHAGHDLSPYPSNSLFPQGVRGYWPSQ